MSGRWEQVVTAVAARCGGSRAAITRVDVDDAGELSVSVAGQRSFVTDGGSCRELLPEEDVRLPLARELPQLRRTGRVEVLAWRPGRRLVLRVDREGGSLVLKGYRRGRSAAPAARHALARAALASAPDHGVVVPELLLHDTALDCLQTRLQAGRALPLNVGGRHRFHRLGMALAALQEGGRHADLPLHGEAEELAVLDRFAARAQAVELPASEAWQALRRQLAAERGPDAVEPLPAHRDLHDGQVLVCGPELVLLDFDLLALADPALDAANLLAHLKLRALQGRADATPRALLDDGHALLDGLDRSDEPGFRARLRWYQAATFLRLALVHGLRPADRALHDPLVALAGRCLEDRRRAR